MGYYRQEVRRIVDQDRQARLIRKMTNKGGKELTGGMGFDSPAQSEPVSQITQNQY